MHFQVSCLDIANLGRAAHQHSSRAAAMVVVQVKRSDTDVFLVESTVTESNDALVRRLVSAGTNLN